jgi:hypothetical protein
MKYLSVLVILILAGCSEQEPIPALAIGGITPILSPDTSVRIYEIPATPLSNEPILIDTSHYRFLIDSLNLQFYSDEYLESIDSAERDDYNYYASLFYMWGEVELTYGALNPQLPVAIIYRHLMETYNCIHTYGAFEPFCMNLIFETDSAFVLIESKEQYQALFSPIESEEEALAYVAIYTDTELRYQHEIEGFRMLTSEINVSYAQRTSNGFNVVTFDRTRYGCGPHTHYQVNSFVDFDGNVSNLNYLEIYQNPMEDNLCID